MKIYTKTGDKGMTSLANGKRVSKSDIRLEAYGTVDELNSFVGLLYSSLQKSEVFSFDEAVSQLTWVQNRLFDVGAILAGSDIAFSDSYVIELESWIDEMDSQLSPLRAFVLPGGSEQISLCHVCRTITRRLERCMVSMGCDAECAVLLRFVNRLSDYCFVLARFVACKLEIRLLKWEK